jgi:UDP-N-acetylglucosamine 2-epimerase (non-hydrolysing)
MVVFGTRPEAIKVAPVIAELRKVAREVQTCVVVTAQHRSMLDQVMEVFAITADYDLNIMQPNQTLADITIRAISGLDSILQRENPDMVLVQGDTTTAFAGGLAAFYRRIPVGHIEAGLRTRDKYNPFPEEINRQLLDVVSDVCFAPTERSRHALLSEGIPAERILVTGNTVIDALLTVAGRTHEFNSPLLRQITFNSGRKTLLVTAHRRESFGAPLRNICFALRELLARYPELQLVFPVHLNPEVRQTVGSILGETERAWLLDPLDYLDFVHLMNACDLVVTDSGGIQEEAPALGKPVFVIRETTERPEALEAGTARLVGTSGTNIVSAVSNVLDNPEEYACMSHAANPFGDGHAASRIVAFVRHYLGLAATPPLPFWGELTAMSMYDPTRP